MCQGQDKLLLKVSGINMPSPRPRIDGGGDVTANDYLVLFVLHDPLAAHAGTQRAEDFLRYPFRLDYCLSPESAARAAVNLRFSSSHATR